MEAILSLSIGYFIGSLSPAAAISKRKNVNLKEEGTGNLGATNAMLVLGLDCGVFVMIFDILKSYVGAKLARVLFPQLVAAGMIACIGVILGHCFPIFHHFQGGRGLASFGGMILAVNWKFFLIILISGFAMMLALDAGVAATITGCVLFPLLVSLNGGNLVEVLLALAASCLLTFMHLDKIKLAVENKGGDHVLATLKEKLFQKS